MITVERYKRRLTQRGKLLLVSIFWTLALIASFVFLMIGFVKHNQTLVFIFTTSLLITVLITFMFFSYVIEDSVCEDFIEIYDIYEKELITRYEKKVRKEVGDLNGDGMYDARDLEIQAAKKEGFARGMHAEQIKVFNCPYCGVENNSEDRFCGGCGAKLEKKVKRNGK